MWQRDLPAEVPSVDADMAVCREGRSETSVQEAHPQLSPYQCGLSELSGLEQTKQTKGPRASVEPRSGGATGASHNCSCSVPSRQPSTPTPPKAQLPGFHQRNYLTSVTLSQVCLPFAPHRPRDIHSSLGCCILPEHAHLELPQSDLTYCRGTRRRYLGMRSEDRRGSFADAW